MSHQYLTTKTYIQTVFQKNVISEIRINFVSSFMFELLNTILLGKLKRQLFHILIKQYVEQSLLWNLCTENSLYCIHAASIEKNDTITVFAGLNGVGKSTLALWLSRNKNSKLYSDNYLLIDESHAYLFPDAIRLSMQSLTELNVQPVRSFGFGKYLVDGSELFSKKKKVQLSKIYLVSRGNKWQQKKLTKKDGTKILQHMQIVNQEEVLYAPVSQFLPTKTTTNLNLKCELKELIIGPRNELTYEL